MKENTNKLKVFISSKIGDQESDRKYILTRSVAKELLESTGLFQVYSFEAEGSSTISAKDHYTENLLNCDICVFLIDNKDGVPPGVQIELETVSKYTIPALYYFCNEDSKEKTSTQIDLENAAMPKHTTIKSFSEFIQKLPYDIMSDLLITFKKASNPRGEELPDYHIDSEQRLSDTSFIEIHSPAFLLEKKNLKNELSMNYFEHLIFGKDLDDSDAKGFDLFCLQFLKTIFEGKNIIEFNMSLFFEELEAILPNNYFEIVKLRWESNQKYYMGDFEKSIELLKEAFFLADSPEANIEEWFIQDILIDLRNREHTFLDKKNQINLDNFAQINLNKRPSVLYYPIIDRKEKNILEWIEKERQSSELRSYTSQHYYGDLSFLSNYVSNIFSQAMMFGSTTYLDRLYDIIQKLTYQIANTANYWPTFMLLLKTTIVSLNKKKTRQISQHFLKIMEKMNSSDARDIYEFSNNIKPQQNTFKANLLAMSEVGYYLSDEDFSLYMSRLIKQINDWVLSDNCIISLQSYIFDCIKGISKRMDANIIIDFSLNIFNTNKKRFYQDTLELLAVNNFDYKRISEESSNKLIDFFVEYDKDNTDLNKSEYIKLIFAQIETMDNDHKKIMESHLEKNWNDYFVEEYNFNRYDSNKSKKILISRKIKEIDDRNSSQGMNGVFFGYATNPYRESLNIIKYSKRSVDSGQLDKLFCSTAKTILSEKQVISDKLDAYILLIYLLNLDKKIIDRNSSIISNIYTFQDYELAQSSFFSSIDSSMLTLCQFLLLELIGKNKYDDIVQIVSTFGDSGRQIEASKIFINFLTISPRNKIFLPLNNLILQSSLLWLNSKNMFVRWHNAKLQVKLYETGQYNEILGAQFLKIVRTDDAKVKSQILSNLNTINDIDPNLCALLCDIASDDSNFVIREQVKSFQQIN